MSLGRGAGAGRGFEGGVQLPLLCELDGDLAGGAGTSEERREVEQGEEERRERMRRRGGGGRSKEECAADTHTHKPLPPSVVNAELMETFFLPNHPTFTLLSLCALNRCPVFLFFGFCVIFQGDGHLLPNFRTYADLYRDKEARQKALKDQLQVIFLSFSPLVKALATTASHGVVSEGYLFLYISAA